MFYHFIKWNTLVRLGWVVCSQLILQWVIYGKVSLGRQVLDLRDPDFESRSLLEVIKKYSKETKVVPLKMGRYLVPELP